MSNQRSLLRQKWSRPHRLVSAMYAVDWSTRLDQKKRFLCSSPYRLFNYYKSANLFVFIGTASVTNDDMLSFQVARCILYMVNELGAQRMWYFQFSVNLPPNITTPSVRYALLGEDLQLQLEGEDPESRPFVISMIDGNPSHAKLSASHILYWKPETQNSTNFFFRATDECNASSTFNMTIEVVICPCTEKGICEPNPGHPRGSGMYVCKCQPGYEGQRCEKEIDECLLSPCVHGEFHNVQRTLVCLRCSFYFLYLLVALIVCLKLALFRLLHYCKHYLNI